MISSSLESLSLSRCLMVFMSKGHLALGSRSIYTVSHQKCQRKAEKSCGGGDLQERLGSRGEGGIWPRILWK